VKNALIIYFKPSCRHLATLAAEKRTVMAQIEIYDTTLRDGTQGLDFNLTSEDKVAIAKRLDGFGINVIEGGWPGSNPKDATFFEMMKQVRLVRAKLACVKGVYKNCEMNLELCYATKNQYSSASEKGGPRQLEPPLSSYGVLRVCTFRGRLLTPAANLLSTST
jgi:hypothetical protein